MSKQELVDSIARIPAFQENGAFNKDRYLRVLAYQRMTPDDFEASQQHQLLIEKVGNKIQAGDHGHRRGDREGVPQPE